MKKKRVILSSLVCLLTLPSAHASDCIGPDCDFAPVRVYSAPEAPVVTSVPVVSAPLVMHNDAPMYMVPGATYPAKMLSVKPVQPDSRPPLWDGTHGKYLPRTTDKTVDWRDGVPIWDDSIAHYRRKDFSDWFLEPLPQFWADQAPLVPVVSVPVVAEPVVADTDIVTMYDETMMSAAATRARVEELLAPRKPSASLWVNDDTIVTEDVVTADYADNIDVIETATVSENIETCDAGVVQDIKPAPKPKYMAQDMTAAINAAFGGDGCPFETSAECEIWRKKPIVKEIVSPRSNHLRADLMENFIAAAQCDGDIDASNPVAAPLVARYKMLMQSANACCTDGMVYALRNAGASDGLIYKFMSDDANFYGFGSRCLMMTDKELDTKYPNTSTAAVAADVRNGCLCRGRQWFDAMLAPFKDAYAASPEFARSMFYYTYTDGLGRQVRVSINNDVQNVLRQLSMCP